MNVVKTAALAAGELQEAVRKIDDDQIEALLEEICNAKKVYVAGAGRSMLMLRGIAMRLMHLGFESYVVGDTTTPAFTAGDLLIVGSGSGETEGLFHIVKKAKGIGGKTAVITVRKASTLGQMADLLVEVPAYTDKVQGEDMKRKRPVLPGGSMFEQCLLLLGDAMVLPLGKKLGIPTGSAFVRHANLE